MVKNHPRKFTYLATHGHVASVDQLQFFEERMLNISYSNLTAGLFTNRQKKNSAICMGTILVILICVYGNKVVSIADTKQKTALWLKLRYNDLIHQTFHHTVYTTSHHSLLKN